MTDTSGPRRVDPLKRRGPLYRAICRTSTSRGGMWLSEHVFWKLDPVLLRLSGGRVRSTGPLPSALLETRGARTGQPRANATLYFHDGADVIIVASKRGAPNDPSWCRNLLAHPDVRFGGAPFRAEVVEDGAERERLWQLADRVFPPFETYRRWAAGSGRTIPIVRLVAR
jgi:deazaflavin-dependent oxidoreductase (nitroreductase family)